MRILMVNPHFPPFNSGSGSVTLRLAQGLRNRGEHVAILTVGVGSGAPSIDEVEGLPVHRVPARALSFGRLAFNYRLPFAMRLGIGSAIDEVLEGEAPDVVHLHGQFWDLNILCARAAHRRAIPTVMSVHTAIVNPNPVLNGLVAFFDRQVIRRLILPYVRAWTGYDRRVLEYITSRYRVDRPVFLPNPVESLSLRAAHPARARQRLGVANEPLVLSVGHVIPQLRDRLSLVRAFAILLEEWPSAKLVVAGKLYDTKFLQLGDSLGISDSVIALGEIPYNEIPDLLAAADVECHDLAGIGIGVATIEAMMAGVPVVMVLRQGDIPEVDFSEYPLLARLEEDGPREVAALMSAILGSEDIRASVSRDGQMFAESVFDLQKVAARAEALYHRVLNQAATT